MISLVDELPGESEEAERLRAEIALHVLRSPFFWWASPAPARNMQRD